MPPPLEFDEQCALVDWMELKGLKFTSVPSSTWTSSWGQKIKNKQSGLRKGFPDLIVLIPAKLCKYDRTVMACIELKRTKGGVTSPEQKEWIKMLSEVADVESMVCKGAEPAIKYLQDLLK